MLEGTLYNLNDLNTALPGLIQSLSQAEISNIGYMLGYNIARRQGYYNRVISILKEKRVHPSTPILECGCGGGGVLRTLYDAGYHNLTGIDSSCAGLALAHSRCPEKEVNLVYGDVRDITSEFGSFGVIIFAQVLEHISEQDDLELLSRLSCLLQKNGFFLCGVPEKEGAPLCYEHVRQYTTDSVLQRYGKELYAQTEVVWTGPTEPKIRHQRNIFFTIYPTNRTREDGARVIKPLLKHEYFQKILEQLTTPVVAIETGRLRRKGALNDGYSTKWLAQCKQITQLFSIDIAPATESVCRDVISKKACNKISFLNTESVSALYALSGAVPPQSIGLLLLDSANDPLLAVKEFLAALPMLASGCLVIVDDVFGEFGFKGSLLLPKLYSYSYDIKRYGDYAVFQTK